MKMAIRFTARQESKALPILMRHSPGTILPNRTYIISADAVKELRAAGIEFTELGSEADAPGLEGVGSGERIGHLSAAELQRWHIRRDPQGPDPAAKASG
jgi:hypothetical protein